MKQKKIGGKRKSFSHHSVVIGTRQRRLSVYNSTRFLNKGRGLESGLGQAGQAGVPSYTNLNVCNLVFQGIDFTRFTAFFCLAGYKSQNLSFDQDSNGKYLALTDQAKATGRVSSAILQDS